MQFLTTTTESYISLFFTLALMLVLLYFMIYRPQKKQEKKDAAMRAALEIGDQVVTIGGIVGRVVAIKDDTFVLETGSDRVKIRFTKNAISSVEKLNMDNAAGMRVFMLEQKKLPILEALAAFGIGGIFTAACMAGLAYLMANQSLAQSTAWPMVSAIVCAGSFCSGWLMAFFYHSRGLICGAVQGGLFVLLLLGFGLSEGIEPTEMQLTRFALVFVFGCLGGVFSILRTERHRH